MAELMSERAGAAWAAPREARYLAKSLESHPLDWVQAIHFDMWDCLQGNLATLSMCVDEIANGAFPGDESALSVQEAVAEILQLAPALAPLGFDFSAYPSLGLEGAIAKAGVAPFAGTQAA